jgi:PAS domain S-box-containing protein
VASWNRGAEEIFGYSSAEMIGKPIHVIAAPSRPKEMEEILDRIRRGGQRKGLLNISKKFGHFVPILRVSTIGEPKAGLARLA